jgi:hypothetical protein
MAFPNGTVITPDGTTLIVGETLAYRLSAFDVASDGTLSNRRVWAQLDFVPTDGMCLDAEGQIWVANALATQCLRVREGGEVTSVVETSQNTFACMLGGTARRTLYIMCAPASEPIPIAEARHHRHDRSRRGRRPGRRLALGQPSLVRARRKLRVACCVRISFSIRAKRTCPSPPSPKPTPGLVATSASSIKSLENSSEDISR